MKKKRLTIEEEFARLFPTRSAWKPADEAVDELDPRAPFVSYVDTWIEKYKAAGGKTEVA